MEKPWVIKDADQYFYRLGIKRATQGLPFADEKNPARAYTFSLFLWGAGQSYTGLRMKGVLFQIIMLAFLVGIVLSLLYGKELLALLQADGISRADVFLSAELLIFAASVFWIYNAVDAYHAAAKSRRVPFHGVQSRILPMLSSFLIPGWGQFMNGQPRKGSILSAISVVSIFSLLTIPAVLVYWPSLEASQARSVVESIFAFTVLYTPLIPIISVLSSYDALKVSLDDVKKETLPDRIMLAINRLRNDGWTRSLFRMMRPLMVFALILGFLLVVKNHYHLSANYLLGYLSDMQSWLQKRGMTVVPDFINRLLA